jgi:hypothetical protein
MPIISVKEISEAKREISGVIHRASLRHSESLGRIAGFSVSVEQPRESLNQPCRS